MTRTTLPNPDRRAQILDAARRVFTSTGRLDAGLRTIAAEAGCTTGALYKHFSGKEDIFAALLDTSLRNLAQRIGHAAACEADAAMSLTAAARAFVDYYQEFPFEAQLGMHLFETDGRAGLGAGRDAALNDLLAQMMAVFVTGYRRLGHSDDAAKDRADALFAALIGVLIVHGARRDRSLGTSWTRILDSILDLHIVSLKDNSVI